MESVCPVEENWKDSFLGEISVRVGSISVSSLVLVLETIVRSLFLFLSLAVRLYP